MSEQTIKISAELAQATVNYLQTRPYGEVFQLISAFQQCAQEADKDLPKPKLDK